MALYRVKIEMEKVESPVCSKVKVRFKMIFKKREGMGPAETLAAWKRVPEVASGAAEAAIAPRRA